MRKFATKIVLRQNSVNQYFGMQIHIFYINYFNRDQEKITYLVFCLVYFVFCLTYAFSRNFVLQFQLKKNYFLKFCQFLKSPPDSGDGDGDGDCDRHGEF